MKGTTAALLLLVGATACAAPGDGEGLVQSDDLIAGDCWRGPFDLRPDFFAGIPFRDSLQIRVQRGDDLAEVSDGVALLVRDVTELRERELGQPIEVGLAPQLLNTIAPGVATGATPRVGLVLSLQRSCPAENVALHAIDGSIVFSALFSGDPNETVGSEKLSDATFDVRVADPREADPGTLVVPPDRISRLTGRFRFHFQRGQPAQPFP
ncbi:MAG: hypothetical protein ACO3JL_09345 [Myxococcota bacterium]